MGRTLFIVILGTGLLGTASAHDLQYSVQHGEAVVVDLRFPYGPQPVYEPYEIYGPEEAGPRQVGRSDAQGRIPFLPDEAGRWRVEVATEDGHGLQAEVQVSEAGEVSGVTAPRENRWVMAGAGLGYLLGLAGLLYGWQQRRLSARGR